MAKKRDVYIGTLLLFFCLWWGFQITKLSDSTLPGAPGPKFFPWVTIVVLIVLSLMLLFSGRKSTNLEKKNLSHGDEPEYRKPHWSKVLFAFVLVLAYIWSIEKIGFFYATFLALVIILRVPMGVNNWRSVIGNSAFITVLIFLVFSFLLKMPLP